MNRQECLCICYPKPKTLIYILLLIIVVFSSINWTLQMFNYNVIEMLSTKMNTQLNTKNRYDYIIYLFISLCGIVFLYLNIQ